MFKRRIEYLILAMVMAVCAVIFCVNLILKLPGSGLSGKGANNDSEEIVYRAASQLYSDEAAKSISDTASDLISGGILTTGDYLVSVYTSPSYYLKGADDAGFARDLTMSITGEEDEDIEEDILEDLEDVSRMKAIDNAVSDERHAFGVSASLAKGTGSVISDVSLQSGITGSSGYTIGIREAAGSFEATGSEVRTDFFVDNVLYHGYLKVEDSDGAGSRDFNISWDTAGVEAGTHDVYIILRSSDGRAKAISTGTVNIPVRFTVAPGTVSNGNIEASKDSAWYMLDCGEGNNCYMDFVDIADDISVTLYDVYGNPIGTNAHEDSKYEVLRGSAQDTAQIASETGIEGVSNCFYAEVRRADTTSFEGENVSYKLVTSSDTAYYNGSYCAVAPDGEDYVLTDINGASYEVTKDEINLLPLSSSLYSMRVWNSVSGRYLGIYPEFDIKTKDYAYYMDGNSMVTVNCEALEGYSATVTIKAVHNGNEITLQPGEIYEVQQGETVITASVNSFDGQAGEYKIYLLNGDDDGSFGEDTLSAFPSSYYSGLWLLHNIRPNYVFKAYNTGLDFGTVLDAENSSGRNLVEYSSFPDYVRANSQVYDAPDWMATKSEVTSYFLDPRNFLIPDRVFMFELLSFDPEVHTVEGVKSIISGSFMDTSEYDYANAIYEAGRNANVSPYFLASRIIQEMGYSGESPLCRGELDGYEGYYNFYNIGAYATTAEGGAVVNGAKYAMWGKDPDEQEISDTEAAMLLPWDSIDKAISGGALWIASGYIDKGQDTLYFQKFDVINDGSELYVHQYAQNVMMAYSESVRYYNSYKNIGMLDQAFEFTIPVYNNMPEEYGYLP
ncbi:MAG: hypothetical protein K5745_04105 [Saccharofermentans sp.]|nr:hypothetical protein [Saccharofermentans sp.]